MFCELTHSVLNKPVRFVIPSHFGDKRTEAQIKTNLSKITQLARSRAKADLSWGWVLDHLLTVP